MINIQGVTPLVSQMEDRQGQVLLGILQNLAVNVLLRARHLAKCVRWMLSVEYKMLLQHSAEDAIMRAGTKAKVATVFSHEVGAHEKMEHVVTPVANLIMIRAIAKSPIVVVPFDYGILTTEWIHSAKLTLLFLPEWLICEDGETVSLRTLITKVSKKPVVLHKQMFTGYITGPWAGIVQPGRKTGLNRNWWLTDTSI